MLLGIFEYESTSLRQDYSAPMEKQMIPAVTTIGYTIAVIVIGIYAQEQD